MTSFDFDVISDMPRSLVQKPSAEKSAIDKAGEKAGAGPAAQEADEGHAEKAA